MNEWAHLIATATESYSPKHAKMLLLAQVDDCKVQFFGEGLASAIECICGQTSQSGVGME